MENISSLYCANQSRADEGPFRGHCRAKAGLMKDHLGAITGPTKGDQGRPRATNEGTNNRQ